jgi:hypothetical protein
MKRIYSLSLLTAVMIVAACTKGADKSNDRFIDSGRLTKLKAGIWIDPTGCDQWLIDDGVEGYLSARLDKYGKPVCSGIAEPNTVVGNFKNDVTGDPI